MLSVHTCPLATLGGKKTGGMNVYVRDLAQEFERRGIQVDVFTREPLPSESPLWITADLTPKRWLTLSIICGVSPISGTR